jgi:hypothetical protein
MPDRALRGVGLEKLRFGPVYLFERVDHAQQALAVGAGRNAYEHGVPRHDDDR